MKKALSLILALVLSLSLCACGKKEPEYPEYNVNDEIRSAVQAEAAVYCIIEYADVKSVMASVTDTDDNGDGSYDVKGYITVIDDYADTYKGKFNAVVKIDDYGKGICTYFYMETPEKA